MQKHLLSLIQRLRALASCVLCGMVATWGAPALATEAGLEVGVLPNVSARVLMSQYEPMQNHLSKNLGLPVQVSTAPNWREFYQRMKQGQYQVVVAAGNVARLAEQGVRQLQALGCHVSLDDFGSGFTSIAYLKQLHADCVKIDGQFILRLATERENQILLRAIVDIAHASGKRVVAEWIEDEASLELVKSFGVDLVQGYLFGHPVPMGHPST